MRGPLHDRRWMLVDADTDAFVTQRGFPALATVDVRVVEGGVEVRADGRPDSLTLPAQGEGAAREVAVWNKPRLGADVGDAAADWFSGLLDHPVRVLADARPSGDAGLAFADGYPLLVTHMASLEDFNSRLAAPLPMERFRPNLVIEGGRAWDEDGWRALRVGELTVELVKPCARCVVINTDQRTGVVDHKPLRELGRFRRFPGGEGAMFGVNGVHSGPGRLRVGAAVEVIAGSPGSL